MPASEVADGRLLHRQRAPDGHAAAHGKLSLFTDRRPGPKGPRKATGELRARVLALRAAGHSVTEIAAALTADGLPVSAQTTWQILDAEGIGRLPRRDEGRRGPPPPGRGQGRQAARLRRPTRCPCPVITPGCCCCSRPWPSWACPGWSAGRLPLDQAAELLAVGWVAAAGQGRPQGPHPPRRPLGDDAGLAFTIGLTALPKATHLGTYSWRVRRESNRKLLAGLVAALRPLGLATGEAGFNCDFHAIRHHGTEAVLEKHYVPRRSQRTRAVLTFFAQDHASAEMVYANADITKAEQAAEIIAFADYWQQATGAEPGMLVFDSQLTTYTILDQLTGRGIGWLTLRQRGKNQLERLAALPASAWKTVTIAAPAATGGPGCTRTWSRSRASAPRSARSRSPASAATSPPC